jgi:hypothetical protein
MPIYFLLQVLQVKHAPFVFEYCINCVFYTKSEQQCFGGCAKKRNPKGVAGPLICYQPDLSTRRSRASGKSLTKQDQQNRRYPKPRKARKRHKKKRPKLTPPSPTVTEALSVYTDQGDSATVRPSHSPWRAPMNTKRGATRNQLQYRRKLSELSPQRLLHSPSTNPTPSLWRASTAGMQNKDVPRPTPTTHGHQMSRKLVRRPRPPSVLNLTQTPTTRTALIVRRHRI